MRTIEDLRESLFDVMAGLRNPDSPMDIDRAKAISDVAQTIINSAKVETEYMRYGVPGTQFIAGDQESNLPVSAPQPIASKPRAVPAAAGSIRSRIIGILASKRRAMTFADIHSTGLSLGHQWLQDSVSMAIRQMERENLIMQPETGRYGLTNWHAAAAPKAAKK